eukprot:140458-Lingulodinium_polyedra.AAC.1
MTLATESMWDPCHRYWNCDKDGLTDAGAWEVVLLFYFPFRINYGPWGTGKWAEVLAGARQEYAESVGSANCPLFRALLPRIALDRGEEHRLGDAGWEQEVWEAFGSALELGNKGPKLAMTRWYSWVDCWFFWDRLYTLRLLACIYWALTAG